jgi:hypothetical protein
MSQFLELYVDFEDVLFSGTDPQDALGNKVYAYHMLTEIGGILVFSDSDLDTH